MKPFVPEPWKNNKIKHTAKLNNEPSTAPTSEPFVIYDPWIFSSPTDKSMVKTFTIKTEQPINIKKLIRTLNLIWTYDLYISRLKANRYIIELDKPYLWGETLGVIKPIINELLTTY